MPENITKPIVLDQTASRVADVLERVSIKSDVIDNLTTESATKALSANQGKVLKGMVDDKVDSSDVYNGLDETGEGKVLDARQGKVLNDAISSLTYTSTISASGTTYGTVDSIHGGKFGRLVIFSIYVNIGTQYTVGSTESIAKINESALFPNSETECISVIIRNSDTGEFTNMYAGYGKIATNGNIYQTWTSNAAGKSVLLTFAYWK